MIDATSLDQLGYSDGGTTSVKTSLSVTKLFVCCDVEFVTRVCNPSPVGRSA